MNNNTTGKKKITCYSDGEQAMMDATQKWRGKIFSPLLNLFVKCRITPNHLTLLSLLAGTGFCLLFSVNKPASFIMLVLHVLLDGLDGPLARYTDSASNQGSFTDTTSDQLVIAFSTITLIHAGYIDVIPGGLYIFFYTVVVIFAMVRNSLSIPYRLILRPRFYVYIWFIVEIYILPGSINYLLWIFTLILGANMFSGFFKIRKKL